MPGSNNWIYGPSLPEPITDGAWTVTSDNLVLVVIGGAVHSHPVDSIYTFECEYQVCKWTLFEKRLLAPKKKAVAMFISDMTAESLSKNLRTKELKNYQYRNLIISNYPHIHRILSKITDNSCKNSWKSKRHCYSTGPR